MSIALTQERRRFIATNLKGKLPPKHRFFKSCPSDVHYFITMACWQAVEHGNVNDLLFAARNIPNNLLPNLVTFVYEATGGMCVLYAASEKGYNGLRIQVRYRFDSSVKDNLFGNESGEAMNFWGVVRHDWKTY